MITVAISANLPLLAITNSVRSIGYQSPNIPLKCPLTAITRVSQV
jgi:hypothetical protein